MDSNHKSCSICDRRHISKPSTEWCSECYQAYCTECKEYHSLMSTTENHMTIPIGSYDALWSSVLSFSNICENHQERYHLYCPTHDKLLCHTCIEEHSECKGIKSINKIAKNIKTSESFNEVRMSLEDIDTNIDKMIFEIQSNHTSTKDCTRIILQQMRETREKLNIHLDTLVTHLEQDLSQLETKAENDVQLTLRNLEEKKIQNVRKQKQIEDMTKYASDLQTFLGLRHLSSDVSTYEAFLRSLLENGSLDKVEITFELNENITRFSNSIKKFGSVQLHTIPGNCRLESQKVKQAQITEERNIDNIVVKLVKTINTNGDSIIGCDFLPDGKMVFSYYSLESKTDFIAVFDSNGNPLGNITVHPNYAFDVVAVDEKHVVVTSPKDKDLCIMCIDIQSKEIVKIKTKFVCRTATVSDGKLLSISPGLGILSIDAKNGNVLSTIENRLPKNTSLTSFKSKLYIGDTDTNTISCSNMDGTTIWSFKDDTVIKNPRGIAVDDMGNVFITNRDLNNVTVISRDGNQSKQLLSKTEGLKNPMAIQYDRTRNRLLVANATGKAFLFDISR